MHIPAPKTHWSASTIKDILTNITYTGKVKRGERGTVKRTSNGSVVSSRPRQKEYEIYDGLHEAIIDEELFNSVQNIFASHISKPVASALEIRNPLAGIVYCSICGKKMIRRPQNKCQTMIICTTKGCKNIGTYESVLEKTVINSLYSYLDKLKLQDASNNINNASLKLLQDAISGLDKEIEQLNNQLEHAYDLVEQGVYTPELFLQRSKSIQQKIDKQISKKTDLEQEIAKEEMLLKEKELIIPKIEQALDVYDTLEVVEKNALLCDIIDRVDYLKTERSKKNGPYDNFTVVVHPRIFL